MALDLAPERRRAAFVGIYNTTGQVGGILASRRSSAIWSPPPGPSRAPASGFMVVARSGHHPLLLRPGQIHQDGPPRPSARPGLNARRAGDEQAPGQDRAGHRRRRRAWAWRRPGRWRPRGPRWWWRTSTPPRPIARRRRSGPGAVMRRPVGWTAGLQVRRAVGPVRLRRRRHLGPPGTSLFNNVGARGANGFDISEADFDAAMAINARSHFFALNFAAPLLRRAAALMPRPSSWPPAPA